MNKVITIFTILILLILSVTADLVSAPKITFEALLIQAESNPLIVKQARKEAIKLGLPVNILTIDKIMLDVKAIEDERIVYAVFNDLANPYKDGYVTFYEDAVKIFSASTSRIDFGNGNIVDNTSGLFNPGITSSSGAEKFLMVPDWTSDRVYLFNFDNGDLVDEAFIPPSNPQLQSPKHALQHFNGRQILVSDQISDLVQKFDTNGTYVGFFAPSTGVNTAILDNIRGIRFLPNRNLLVTVGSGPSINTIQQFDTGGVSIGAFITGNISSPFDILLRQNDILISNFLGTNRISRFDNAGNFLSSFYTGSDFALPQQLYRLDNGNILAAAFSTPSGLAVLDSTGVFKRLFTNVTGLRGVHILG
ncbi:MAG: hypothetical protein M3P82_02075, partial [Bacteroidota bacterium]|nr:hypothetical protein [Bacteroidota bacterium]